jgi:hypothetical protein
VEKENRVHGFTDLVHTTEGKGQVGNTTTDFGTRECGFDTMTGIDEFNSIVVVFL